MASGGGKNIGLIIIAVVAIGGAAYLLSQSLGGNGGSVDQNETMYFILNGTETSAEPVGMQMTMSKYNSHVRNREKILIDGSDDVGRAGVCPNGHYYPLDSHLSPPANCPAEGCNVELAGYDVHGNPR